MSDAPPDAPTRSFLRTRLPFIGCAIALLAAAMVIGISDNPPGILLAYAASVCAVLALTTGWQHPRKHFYLFVGSLLAFVVTAILHNVFEGVASVIGVPWLKAAGGAIGAAFFLIAILLCPAGMLVGAAGGIASMLRRKPPAAT
jgi:uncharacterized membrane protein YdcZ (DUF606 family)